MPITPISRVGRLGTLGSYYACSDYLNTNPEFGSVEDFKWLVEQAHELWVQSADRLGCQSYWLGSCMDN